jgi:putative acetyltransferase
MIEITTGDLDDPQVAALLLVHVTLARAETPACSAHALDNAGLRAPAIAFYEAREDGALLGVGALKRLTAEHGEVKSMHTARAARGRGAGSAMLAHIVAQAKAAGMSRLSLETGAAEYFAAARRLYAHHGFVECPPFDAYVPDRNSVFMTLALRGT